MPNRILRDWTDSVPVNSLSAQAERFFVRLIQKADDQGRYTGHHRLLKSQLFPLLPEVRETDIPRWLAECETAGLIALYESGGKPWVVIRKFRQRERTPSSRPPPPDHLVDDDGAVLDRGPPAAAGAWRSNDRGPPSNDRPGAAGGAGAQQQQTSAARERSVPVRPAGGAVVAAAGLDGNERRIMDALQSVGVAENGRTRRIAAEWADVPDAEKEIRAIAERLGAAGKGIGALVVELESAVRPALANAQRVTREGGQRQMALSEEAQRIRLLAEAEKVAEANRQNRLLEDLPENIQAELKERACQLAPTARFRERWTHDDWRTNRVLRQEMVRLLESDQAGEVAP